MTDELKDKIKIKAVVKDFAGNHFNIRGAYFKKSISRSDWYGCSICRKDIAQKEWKYVYSGWHVCVPCALAHEWTEGMG